MPLRYRRDGNNYSCDMYPNISDLNGEGVSADHRVVVRRDGNTRYIGVTTDLDHEFASHLRVRIDGVTYAVMHYSKQETQISEEGTA